MRRLPALALAVITAALMLAPAAAWADPAVPTNYRSMITAEPGQGFDARIIGGDAFLEFTVDLGVEVFVLGNGQGTIEPEQFLWFDTDGKVYANLRSPYWYVIGDRYAAVEIPDSADVSALPVWEEISDGGVYAWHDHRIHWMSPQPPPAVRNDPNSTVTVFDWDVPVVVAGESTSITGTLEWVPDDAPLSLAIALVPLSGLALGATALASRRRLLLVLAALEAGVAATIIAVGELSLDVAGAAGPLLGLILGGLAIISATVGFAVMQKPFSQLVRPVAASAALSFAFVAVRVVYFARPVLPTTMSTTFTRILLAWVAGAAVAAAGLLVLERKSSGMPTAGAADGETDGASEAAE